MNASDIREFVSRDRSCLEESKRAYWADVFQRDGWRVVWDAAQALLLHARSAQPAFPHNQAREADLADHLKLRASLDRAAHAFARR